MFETQDVFSIANSKLMDLISQFEAIKDARSMLDEREAALNKDWEAWYHIWSREKPAVPETLQMAAEADLDGLNASLDASADEPVFEINRISKNKTYGAKTAAVKLVLAEAGTSGITPKELSEELKKRGVETSESFAGNTLFRLKNKGEVYINSDERYVLAQFAAPQEEEVVEASA